MEQIKILPIEKTKYGDNEVAINDISVTYVQTSDWTEEEGCQTLTLSTRNHGVARFLNINTGPEGWSINGIDDLKMVIDDFKKRALLDDN